MIAIRPNPIRAIWLIVFRCALAAGLLVLVASDALARGHALVLYGDTIGGRTILSVDNPALNSVGDVIFTGYWYEGSQGRIGVLHISGTLLVPDYSNPISINDAGRVVHVGGFYDNGVLKSALIDLDGTWIVGSDDIIAGKTLKLVNGSAINNQGIVAFEASFGNAVWGVFDTRGILHAAPGNPIGGGTATAAYWPSINDAGQVSYWAVVRDANGQSWGGLFRSDGRLLVTGGDVLAGKTIVSVLGHPALMSTGEAVFSASYSDGGVVKEGVFRSDGTLLVDDWDVIGGRAVTGFRSVAANSAGDLVIEASYLVDGFFHEGLFFLGADELEPDPAELIAGLILDVGDVNARSGVNNSLDAKLDAALMALTAENADQRQDVVNKLGAFIRSVEAQRGKQISQSDADRLIGNANRIIQLLQ